MVNLEATVMKIYLSQMIYEYGVGNVPTIYGKTCSAISSLRQIVVGDLISRLINKNYVYMVG